MVTFVQILLQITNLTITVAFLVLGIKIVMRLIKALIKE